MMIVENQNDIDSDQQLLNGTHQADKYKVVNYDYNSSVSISNSNIFTQFRRKNSFSSIV